MRPLFYPRAFQNHIITFTVVEVDDLEVGRVDTLLCVVTTQHGVEKQFIVSTLSEAQDILVRWKEGA